MHLLLKEKRYSIMKNNEHFYQFYSSKINWILGKDKMEIVEHSGKNERKKLVFRREKKGAYSM